MMAPFASPSAAYKVQEATDDDLAWVVDRFVDAACRVSGAGFDGIELHAGHGYLLHAFLSPASNQRTDRWGGSVEARAELFVEVVRAVRAARRPDVPAVGPGRRVRGPPRPRASGSTTRSSRWAWASTPASTPSTSPPTASRWWPRASPTATRPTARARSSSTRPRVRRELGVPVIAMGRLTPEAAEQALADGAADVIAMGRPLIADPDLPEQAGRGPPRPRAALRLPVPLHRVDLPERAGALLR